MLIDSVMQELYKKNANLDGRLAFFHLFIVLTLGSNLVSCYSHSRYSL